MSEDIRTDLHPELEAMADSISISSKWTGIILPLAFFVVGLALLLYHIGSHPFFPYNWEPYTIWYFLEFWAHPSWNVLHLTDGLMTESGKSPLVVLPIWLAFKLNGVSLTQLRIPLAVVTGAAIPVYWLMARRISGAATAALATSLLIISPVFLLYGRTATNVGLSLLPTLLTCIIILRFLQQPRQWLLLIALQVMFLVNSYAYGPIRFLWPLSVVLLIGEMFWQPNNRRSFFYALIPTILILPFFLTVLSGPPRLTPIEAIGKYFNARGEQIFIINGQNGYPVWVRSMADTNTEGAESDNVSLALSLILQNAQDYGRKLFDRDTKPALTSYWSPEARFNPSILVPFFLLGLLFSFARYNKDVGHRVLLVSFLGFGLPLLLTSHVDIGRLIFTLPFLMLIVANGFFWLIRISPLGNKRYVTLVATCLLIVIVAFLTWQDYRLSPPLPAGQDFCKILQQSPPEITNRSYYFGCE